VAEKLSESSWTSLTRKLKVELEDGALIKVLARFDKTDADKPEPRADAAQAVADQIKKFVPAITKQKKELGDKPFGELKDKLYALLDLAEQAVKDAQQALSAAEDDGESPALLSSKMRPLLRELKKGEARMPTLICTAGKNTAVLIMRRPISPTKRKLLAEAVDAAGGAKYITGECFLEKNALTFVVASPSGGLAKRLRQALLDQTELRVKVRVRGDDGAEDEDGENEEGEIDDGEIEAEEEQTSAPTTPSAEAGSYAQRLAKVQDRLAAALKAQHPESTKLRAVLGFAQGKAEQQDYVAAGQSLDMLEKLLSASTPTASSPSAAPGTAGGGSFVNMQKARLAWLQTRQAVQGELKKLEASILADFKDEPDFAQIQNDVRGIDQVLQVLDEELADTLDAALNASDPDERQRLHLQAREQLDAYGAYVASDPFVAELDANPFAPIKIREIVTRSLAVLSKTLV